MQEPVFLPLKVRELKEELLFLIRRCPRRKRRD